MCSKRWVLLVLGLSSARGLTGQDLPRLQARADSLAREWRHATAVADAIDSLERARVFVGHDTIRVGALLATMSAAIPAGLQGYPVALAVRFALAVLVAFAVFFAVSAGTARTAGIVLALIGGVILVQVIANVARVDLDLVGKLQLVVLNWPGPLAIFTGRWMLIDV